MNNINPRKAALKILIDIDENKSYSNILLNSFYKNNNIDSRDKRFITQLVYGVLENKLYLDYVISIFSKTKINKINKEILNILRLGIYQILFLNKIPESAAVNESVKLAKKNNYRFSGFVNGILRNVIRNIEKTKITNALINKDPKKYLSIKYSHPQWLVEKWIDDYGVTFTEELLEVNNSIPSLTIRTNTLKITRDDLISKLKSENVKCTKGHYVPESIIIEDSPNNIEELSAYKEGLFQVQDESSMLVGHILDPKAGEFIIDVCSAPGGKSTHFAQLMNNKGSILSRDIYEHKLELINQNANRLGINIIKTERYDAEKLDKSLISSSDKVLVDAPCSGFGIIRRKPEIKYHKNPEDITNLTLLQLRILNNSAKYVKIGGELVYSTCTIQNEENIGVMNSFLEQNNNFKLLDLSSKINIDINLKNKFLQLYPNINGIDGFFICKFRRVK